jgi:putative DNA primase/helicase
VRALLLLGQWNNGKDTLREVTAMMYGYLGMVGATLGDFKQYDQGRKFPLSKLDGALINWPSENADSALLDRVQSAKIAITGDP